MDHHGQQLVRPRQTRLSFLARHRLAVSHKNVGKSSSFHGCRFAGDVHVEHEGIELEPVIEFRAIVVGVDAAQADEQDRRQRGPLAIVSSQRRLQQRPQAAGVLHAHHVLKERLRIGSAIVDKHVSKEGLIYSNLVARLSVYGLDVRGKTNPVYPSGRLNEILFVGLRNWVGKFPKMTPHGPWRTWIG